MSYLIDGHNLIPHVRGLSLNMVEDETLLIEILKVFCRERRTHVDCFFDNAQLGLSSTQRYGRLTVYFMPSGRTADDGILNKLRKLKRDARNWIVVSSDQSVQGGAREVHAQVISAEAFSKLLDEMFRKTETFEKQEEIELTQDEVNEWLQLFKKRSRKDRK